MKNVDFVCIYTWRVYHVSESSMEFFTNIFCANEISYCTFLFHHECTNPNKTLSDNSINTCIYSVENNTDPMYKSFFLPSNNDSELYFYDTCDNSVESLASQPSSENSIQYLIGYFDDCARQKIVKVFFKILESLRNSNTELLSTNSSSISNTGKIKLIAN